MVSWDDCQKFIEKLNAKNLPSIEGMRFRLPTEAEWEYACRAGTTTRFYWGDKRDSKYCWHCHNSSFKVHPVGKKKPNAWGLYDMLGNVWEYCSDWYGPYNSDTVNDPVGPAKGWIRIARGGSWLYAAVNCRSAARNINGPANLDISLGLRLVLSK